MDDTFSCSSPSSPLLLLFFFSVFFHDALVIPAADISTTIATKTNQRASPALYDCNQCIGKQDISTTTLLRNNYPHHKKEEDIDIIAAYSDAHGHVRLARLKMSHLSHSWIWENPTTHATNSTPSSQDLIEHNPNHETILKTPRSSTMTPVKTKRRIMREERRKARASELMQQDKETDNHR